MALNKYIHLQLELLNLNFTEALSCPSYSSISAQLSNVFGHLTRSGYQTKIHLDASWGSWTDTGIEQNSCKSITNVLNWCNRSLPNLNNLSCQMTYSSIRAQLSNAPSYLNLSWHQTNAHLDGSLKFWTEWKRPNLSRLKSSFVRWLTSVSGHNCQIHPDSWVVYAS